MELFSYHLEQSDFILFFSVAVLVGMAKTGVSGAGMIVVPMLAIIFGGKNSSGVLLPILIFADVFGVRHYHRHAEWHHLKKLLPFAIIGVLIGTYTGQFIDDEMFKQIMAIIIFISLGIMLWLERGSKKVPHNRWFAATTGVLGGFTTMVGNLAGAVMSLYLLAMQLPKNRFIGTAAWFFLIINILKVPFHVFVWETITVDSFLLDLTTIPSIAVGAFLGIWITKKIPEKLYRYFIILMTAIAAVFMVL
ncbi:MAG: sulfite exporter TauE/SafE family protein [Cyclobacteriaceae bacterium]